MNNTDNQQEIQKKQYQYPYHYLLDYNNNEISVVNRYDFGFTHYSFIYLIKKIIIKKKIKSILDVGCGDGKLIYEICKDTRIQNVINKIVGIDLDSRPIAFARIFNEDNKAEFLVKNIHQYHQDLFDLVILTEVIEHIQNAELKLFMKKINSLIAEDKYLILSTPSINLPLQSKHYRHYDLNSLKKLLYQYFNIKVIFYIGATSLYSKFIKQIYMFLDYFKIHSLKKKIFSHIKKKIIFTSDNKCQYIMVLCKKK